MDGVFVTHGHIHQCVKVLYLSPEYGVRAIISLLTVHVTPKIRLYTCKMLLSFAILCILGSSKGRFQHIKVIKL